MIFFTPEFFCDYVLLVLVFTVNEKMAFSNVNLLTSLNYTPQTTFTIFPDDITNIGTQTFQTREMIIPLLTSAQWETLQKMLGDYEQLKKEHDEFKKENMELKKHVYFLVDRLSVEQTFDSIDKEVGQTQVNDTK